MTRPVICVETGGATGISKMRRDIPMYVRVYPKRYGT